MTAILDLVQLVEKLRHPEHGCAWDIRQTSVSIAPHTLDETHELLDAIERDDSENLKEELGDLLFNILFHARIAEEKGQFDFNDVAQAAVDKMTRRHPHVFGPDKHKKLTEAELKQQWQVIKQQEKLANKQKKPPESSLMNDSASNSSFYTARQLQKQAAEFGFDWPDISPVFDKLDEETNELKQAISSSIKQDISDEMGDILFVCVNLARHAGVDAEMALRGCNRKFKRRFDFVHRQMLSCGYDMGPNRASDDGVNQQMEQFWQESKAIVG